MLSKTITDKLDAMNKRQLSSQRIMALDYEDKAFQDEIIDYIDYKLHGRNKKLDLLKEIAECMPDIDDIH